MSTTATPSGWDAARRILCVRLDNMGDVLMSTPAMQALADSGSDRRLTLLTSHASAALGPHLPMIQDVIAWDAPWVRHPETPGVAAVARGLDACAARLAAQAFDAAVVFTVYSQSALPAAILCSMAGIPLRLAHCRENPYALLSDWLPETEPANRPRHEARRQLDLVAHVGATTTDTRLRFEIHANDRAAAAARLGALAPLSASGMLVVVHPGATAASRRWPADRFAEVARQLAMQTGARVVVTGTNGERPLAEAVCAAAAHPAVVSMAGALSLGEMAALLEMADLLVSNNSGPVHLAAATGTPLIDLYALTNPQHTPWQVPHRTLFADVPCRYCYKSTCPQGHHRCLLDVSARAVLAAALALLDGEAGPPDVMPWGPAPAAIEPAITPVAAPAIESLPQEDTHVHAWH